MFLDFIPALVLIGAMVWGFQIAGRRVENVGLQLLLGALLGVGILIGVVCVICGVLFAGCLIMGAPSFH